MKKDKTNVARPAGSLMIVMGLIFSFLLSPVLASANVVRQTNQTPRSITIAAGASATLTARGFCLDFGKPFPTQDMTARNLAVDKIRAALNYSIQKGYTDGNPQQVELAVWYLRDNTWHGEQHTIADEIVRESATAQVPTSTGDGTSISDAVSQNKVTVTAKFVPQTADAFYGDATVTIRNTGTSEMKVYMPVGVTFSTIAGGNFQDLIAYELAVQQGTTTPGATASPATTLQPTIQPSLTAQTTPVGTTTAVASVTAVSTGTVAGTAGTAVATTTVVGTAQATTTVAATAESTTTAAATTEATATEVATAEAAPTETPVSQPLPQTGSESGNTTALIVFALGLAMMVAGIGTTTLARRSR
ncbi:MAG TPA: hypothetical protein VM409_05590 [Chloroflexia bacterium]|nr:hypothetical protein [Chloroflexia bacterium]